MRGTTDQLGCYLLFELGSYYNEILSAFGHSLMEHDLNPPVFQQAMGTERYIFRSPNETEIFDIADFVLKKR